MISWLWLIPTALISAIFGLLLISWLVTGKIADLENALYVAQMSRKRPLPLLDKITYLSPSAELPEIIEE